MKKIVCVLEIFHVNIEVIVHSQDILFQPDKYLNFTNSDSIYHNSAIFYEIKVKVTFWDSWES